jgi:hypothetical protein
MQMAFPRLAIVDLPAPAPIKGCCQLAGTPVRKAAAQAAACVGTPGAPAALADLSRPQRLQREPDDLGHPKEHSPCEWERRSPMPGAIPVADGLFGVLRQ